MIAEERARQIQKEGWTPAHDDTHVNGELREAGMTYAAACDDWSEADKGRFWPWEKTSFKPSDDPVQNLVKAGALYAAEIDRLLRMREPANAGEGCVFKHSELMSGFVFESEADKENVLLLLEDISRVQRDSNADRGGTYLVCGPPGCGKTTLIRRLLKLAGVGDLNQSMGYATVLTDFDRHLFIRAVKGRVPVLRLELCGSAKKVSKSLSSPLWQEWLAADVWPASQAWRRDPKTGEETLVDVSQPIRCVTVMDSFWAESWEWVSDKVKVIRLKAQPEMKREAA